MFARMAERVLQFTATIPAGTAITAPVTVAMPFDGWEIERIDLDVPPGPAGAMGFVLANNGQPWIPRSAGEWLIWDDHAETFPTTGYPSAGGWAVIAYNTGIYAHSVVTRFHVNPVIHHDGTLAPVVLTFIEHDVTFPPPVVL